MSEYIDDKFKQARDKLLKRLNVKFFNEEISKDTMNREMSRIHSQIFSVGLLKAEKERNMNKAKAKMIVMKAKVDKKIRKTASKKPSEREIEKRVACHPSVCRAADEYADAKFEFNVCWAAVNALNAKADQLANISYNYRKELETIRGSKVRETKVKEARVKRKLKKGE